jgi:hypothetical protein
MCWSIKFSSSLTHIKCTTYEQQLKRYNGNHNEEVRLNMTEEHWIKFCITLTKEKWKWLQLGLSTILSNGAIIYYFHYCGNSFLQIKTEHTCICTPHQTLSGISNQGGCKMHDRKRVTFCTSHSTWKWCQQIVPNKNILTRNVNII